MLELWRGQRPYFLVGLQQGSRLGDVEARVLLEAPGVKTDGDVIGERVVASEIEIDQPRDLVAEEEHVVGEKIGMDHSLRQLGGPGPLEMMQLLRDLGGKPRRNLVGAPADLAE